MYEYTVLFQIKFFHFFNLHKSEPPRKEQRIYKIFSYGMHTILHIQLRYSFPPNSNDDKFIPENAMTTFIF